MAQIRGKQLLLNSINLDRLDLNNYTVGDTIAGVDSEKVLVNKEYADTLASGFDVKESSTYSTELNIANILTATESAVISALDGIESPGIIDLVNTDRVLVKDQTLTNENGIYMWNGTSLERAQDFDGSPENEVSQGGYTFVVLGTNNEGFGFMVINKGSLSDGYHDIGTDPIIWSRVSKSIAYAGGEGIDIDDTIINVDLETTSGLTFTGTHKLDFSLTDYFTNSGVSELGSSMNWSGTLLDLDYAQVAASLAGDGLSAASDGTLNVDPIAVPVEYSVIFDVNEANVSPVIVEMENFATLTSGIDWTTLLGTTKLNLNGLNYEVGISDAFWYSDTIIGTKSDVPTSVYTKLYVDTTILTFELEEGIEPDKIKVFYHLNEVQ